MKQVRICFFSVILFTEIFHMHGYGEISHSLGKKVSYKTFVNKRIIHQ